MAAHISGTKLHFPLGSLRSQRISEQEGTLRIKSDSFLILEIGKWRPGLGHHMSSIKQQVQITTQGCFSPSGLVPSETLCPHPAFAHCWRLPKMEPQSREETCPQPPLTLPWISTLGAERDEEKLISGDGTVWTRVDPAHDSLPWGPVDGLI